MNSQNMAISWLFWYRAS